MSLQLLLVSRTSLALRARFTRRRSRYVLNTRCPSPFRSTTPTHSVLRPSSALSLFFRVKAEPKIDVIVILGERKLSLDGRDYQGTVAHDSVLTVRLEK